MVQLTDVCDGQLAIDGRSIPLAAPVRDRLATYLTFRNTRWPESVNNHLIINSRTHRRDDPAGERERALRSGGRLAADEAAG